MQHHRMRPGGVFCRVSDDGEGVLPSAQGQLCEVRRYYGSTDDVLPALQQSRDEDPDQSQAECGASSSINLYGYVRFKDLNNRRSRWVPVNHITIAAMHAPSSQSMDGSGEQQPSHAWVHPACPIVSDVYYTPTDEMRTARSNLQHTGGLMELLDARLRRDIQCPPPVRYFRYLDRITFSPWYYSPFNEIFPYAFDWRTDQLYDVHLCPYTLRCFSSAVDLQLFHYWLFGTADTRRSAGAKSAVAPRYLHPPGGVEVYRDETAGISIFELHGKNPNAAQYCRSLFLIGKSFLENKLAGHDVDVYVFYALCVHADKHTPWVAEAFVSLTTTSNSGEASAAALLDWQTRDAQVFAGYFSWEDGVDHDNLACIAVLPCFSSMGLGHVLISASYEFAYRRGNVGSPERPLSDLGQVAYRKYWLEVVFLWLAFRLAAVLEKELGFEPSGCQSGDDLRHSAQTSDNLSTKATRHVVVVNDDVSMYNRARLRRQQHGTSAADAVDADVDVPVKSYQNPAPAALDGAYFGKRYSRRSPKLEDITHCISFLRACAAEMLRWQAEKRSSSHHNGDGSSSDDDARDNRTVSTNRRRRSVIVSDDSDASDDSDHHEEAGSEGEVNDSEANEEADEDPLTPAALQLAAKKRVEGGGEVCLRVAVSISEIAHDVKLEEADVLDALLSCGLLHRGSQDNTSCLKVPIHYVASVLERRFGTGQEGGHSVARFSAANVLSTKRKRDRGGALSSSKDVS